MPFYPKKKGAAKKPRAAPSVSKPLKKAIAQVLKKQIETKTINVPDPTTGLLPKNTVNRQYLSASGVQYLVEDVFRVPQGTADSTALASGNRIGDKVRAIGFKMNYFLHTASGFTLGGSKFQIPFVKVRIIVFTTAYGVGTLNLPLLYNNDFLNAATFVQQPVNFDEGYVKEVLYDKMMIINNDNEIAVDSITTPNTQLIYASCRHFQKYIKFDRPVKYMDNNSVNPTGTDKPIYVAITAEIDDSFVGGIPPSGTPLLYMTGYTQAYFKDG